jgi:hypothetical protein
MSGGTWPATAVALALALLSIRPAAAQDGGAVAPSLGEPRTTRADLQQEVAQPEEQLARAEAALAMARARLAEQDGRRELAAAEWRKAVGYFQRRLGEATALAASGRLCTREPLDEAAGQLAIVRCRLAEAERDREALLRQLRGVIAYYEQRAERVRRLRDAKAIPADETGPSVTTARNFGGRASGSARSRRKGSRRPACRRSRPGDGAGATAARFPVRASRPAARPRRRGGGRSGSEAVQTA